MSLSYNGSKLIYLASRALGVIRSTDVATPNWGLPLDFVNDGFDTLNRLLDAWQIDSRKVFAIRPDQYPLTGGVQFYLIGTGAPASTVINGNTYVGIDTPRPTQIEEANIIINTASPGPPRYPMAIINAQEWASISVQQIPFGIPQALWYDFNFSKYGTAVDGLAAISLWPGPQSSYPLELFTWQQLQQFADLTTSYTFPPGYGDAVMWSLAEKLGPFARMYFKIPNAIFQELYAEVNLQANAARQAIDDYNARVQYMQCDPAYMGSGRGAWSYLTGGFGRSL